MARIDTSFAQTAEQRLAKAQKKRKTQEAAQARVNAARKAAKPSFQPASPTKTQPATRSRAPGLRQRFQNFANSRQTARNKVIDKAVSDSVNATETGRRRPR